MTHTGRTEEQLLDELAQLRQRVQELEQCEEQCKKQVQVAHQQLSQEQIGRFQAEQSRQAVVQEFNTLQERQDFLEKLTQMSPGLLYLFDAIAQRNIYINARSQDLLGYSPETVLAMGADFITRLMHPDDLVQMSAHFERLAQSANGSFSEMEYRMRHAEGEWRWFSSRDTVFSRTGDGNVHQILGTAQDITDRKKIEAALQESRSLFESFMNHAPIAAYIKDRNGCYLYLKPLIEQLRQFNSVDLVGKTDFDFFSADIAEQLRVNDAVVLANGQAVQVPETIEVDGEKRYFMSFKFPFDTASGQQVLAGISIDITALQQAEVTLHESQRLYQMLAEALPNLVWTLTPDGKLDFANQQWQEALGVTPEQVNQAGWSLVVHPDDIACILEDWAQIEAGATITEREYRHRMADGSYRWFLARMLVIRDAHGQLIRMIGASTDIDERKQMEEALRSSEERLALASQAAQVGTFEWNIQTNQVFWTKEEEALYGLSPGGFGGRFENWRQTLHPEDRDRTEQEVLNAIASRTDLNNEFRIVHPDSSVRWMAAKGRVFYDSENRPLRMVGMNEDITDRKQLEVEREQLLQQLETSLGQFEAVINSMTEGLLVSDAQGNVLLFNPAALVLHEYDSVEQVRRHLYEFPDTFEGHDAQGNFIPLAEWPLGRVLRGETYRDYEINVHRLDTGTRWIGSFSGTPVYDKQGKMILAIVTMHDISDRKRAEAERLQLLEQERKAREQAEAANRIKDEFLAVLSHELRTPLNPILGWSRLIRRGKLDESKTKLALETIERNAQLQVQLIDDLLDISRILQGKVSLNSAPVDLKTIITAAIETVRLAAEAKAIHIQTNFALEVGTVLGDAARLQQVIWNLLTNAVKFTPEGGRVEVKLEHYDFSNLYHKTEKMSTQSSRSYAQIIITDTGRGIQPEFLPYIFETFRQADTTTTRIFGGLGLGLAIVRHLVELHGGIVKAESAGEGQGATFTVALPLMPAPVSPTQEAVAISDPLPLRGIHILTVDDEVDNLELVQFILEQAGAMTIAASSANEALEKLHHSKPHLIVSDIAMPEVDGYTLIQQIRELPPERGGQIPAIALTAYAGEMNQQQALAAGFQMHLPKPVDPEALVQAISKLLHPIKSG